MTDYSRDRLGPDDEDRLPWLEPVEEELEEEGGISSRLVIWLVTGLLLVAIIVGGFLWMRGSDDTGTGEGGLIAAPDAYYKERAVEEAPDGRDDEIVYSASKGNEVESVIDTSRTAENPVNVDRPEAAEALPAAAPAPTVTKNAPTATPKPTAPTVVAGPAPKSAPKPAPKTALPPPAATSGGGGTIQIGAFSSQAKATAAWKNLAGRFSFLSGLTESVVPVQSGDKTLYRLRASGGDARDICGRLRTAGESCAVIG